MNEPVKLKIGNRFRLIGDEKDKPPLWIVSRIDEDAKIYYCRWGVDGDDLRWLFDGRADCERFSTDDNIDWSSIAPCGPVKLKVGDRFKTNYTNGAEFAGVDEGPWFTVDEIRPTSPSGKELRYVATSDSTGIQHSWRMDGSYPENDIEDNRIAWDTVRRAEETWEPEVLAAQQPDFLSWEWA